MTTIAPPAPVPSVRSVPIVTALFHGLLHQLSGLVLAGFWLALLITGWVLVVVFAITPLLPAMLIGFAAAVRFAVWIEGYLARRLLGAPVAPRRIGPARRGYWASIGSVLGSARFWTGQAYLLLRTVLGLVTGTVALSFLGSGLFLVAAPIVYRFIPADDGGKGIDFEFWTADTLGEALLLVPVGLVVVALSALLIRLFAALWRALAVGLLGGEHG